MSGLNSAQVVQRYAAGTVLQAGPGIPAWRYNSYNYFWSGPVESADTVRFIYVGPGGAVLLAPDRRRGAGRAVRLARAAEFRQARVCPGCRAACAAAAALPALLLAGRMSLGTRGARAAADDMAPSDPGNRSARRAQDAAHRRARLRAALRRDHRGAA